MEIDRLMKIKRSDEAPFDHDDYTVWIHNKIMDDVRSAIWEHRESTCKNDGNLYALQNKLLVHPKLQIIK